MRYIIDLLVRDTHYSRVFFRPVWEELHLNKEEAVFLADDLWRKADVSVAAVAVSEWHIGRAGKNVDKIGAIWTRLGIGGRAEERILYIAGRFPSVSTTMTPTTVELSNMSPLRSVPDKLAAFPVNVVWEALFNKTGVTLAGSSVTTESFEVIHVPFLWTELSYRALSAEWAVPGPKISWELEEYKDQNLY